MINENSSQVCKICGSNDNKVKIYPSGDYMCYSCYLVDKQQFYEKEMKKTVIIPEIHSIRKNIYIGNSDSGRIKDKLISLGITHILMLGSYLFAHFPENFIYKNIEIEDIPQEDISKYFIEAFNFIESSKIILIHCHAGISRSASFIIAYLMWKDKMSFMKVYSYVMSKKKNISPIVEFKHTLSKFDKFLVKNNYDIHDLEISKEILNVFEN